MAIERPNYLKQLINQMHSGQIKIITGLRRCGKSFLLFNIFRQYLLNKGCSNDQIIMLALDELANYKYRNPFELDKYLRSKILNAGVKYYLFIDEIQTVQELDNPYLPPGADKITFVDVLLGLMKLDNVDIYVTGSNSKMLSSEVLTQFRGRGHEIRVNPLSFAEFMTNYDGSKEDGWREYFTYGGMPYITNINGHTEKSRYLHELLSNIYLRDILEHNNIRNARGVLDDLLDTIASAVGSLTNSSRIANTFSSTRQLAITPNTITNYLYFFIDAYLLSVAKRYNIKGRKYIGSPFKYYFTDIGLRNARLNFRQTEEKHIMENIIYNELLCLGFDVDVGVVEYNYRNNDGKNMRTNLEIDFVANSGNQRYYIQSALTVADDDKRQQETASLNRINDSFRKIVILKDDVIPWYDEKGILYVGIKQFLLNEQFFGSL